jgi:hypothetical protein
MIRPDIWRSPGWVFDHKRPDEGHVKRRGIYHDIERVLVPTRFVALPQLWRHSWRRRVVRATVAREGDPDMDAPAMPYQKRNLGLALAATSLSMLGAPARPASACTTGDEACPMVLKMQPGAVSVTESGDLTQNRPTVAFRFEARAGQTVVVHVSGPATKGQLPLSGPISEDAGGEFNQETPFKLPASGIYTFTVYANMMADGAFGRFILTLTIK